MALKYQRSKSCFHPHSRRPRKSTPRSSSGLERFSASNVQKKSFSGMQKQTPSMTCYSSKIQSTSPFFGFAAQYRDGTSTLPCFCPHESAAFSDSRQVVSEQLPPFRINQRNASAAYSVENSLSNIPTRSPLTRKILQRYYTEWKTCSGTNILSASIFQLAILNILVAVSCSIDVAFAFTNSLQHLRTCSPISKRVPATLKIPVQQQNRRTSSREKSRKPNPSTLIGLS